MAVKLAYVNFHNKKWIDVEALIRLLREIAGNPEKVRVDLDLLASWIEDAEYPEPIQ